VLVVSVSHFSGESKKREKIRFFDLVFIVVELGDREFCLKACNCIIKERLSAFCFAIIFGDFGEYNKQRKIVFFVVVTYYLLS